MNKILKECVTGLPMQSPETLRLAERQLHTGHLQELTLDSAQNLVVSAWRLGRHRGNPVTPPA